MFSSYPTTTMVPTRRAQTPPVSSLPTSPSDEVGRRQSLTSPDSQSSRPQNRTGTCKYGSKSIPLKCTTASYIQYLCSTLCFAPCSFVGPDQQTVHVPSSPGHRRASAGNGLLPAADHEGVRSHRSVMLSGNLYMRSYMHLIIPVISLC